MHTHPEVQGRCLVGTRRLPGRPGHGEHLELHSSKTIRDAPPMIAIILAYQQCYVKPYCMYFDCEDLKCKENICLIKAKFMCVWCRKCFVVLCEEAETVLQPRQTCLSKA